MQQGERLIQIFHRGFPARKYQGRRDFKTGIFSPPTRGILKEDQKMPYL
jgi:hypothetical protein